MDNQEQPVQSSQSKPLAPLSAISSANPYHYLKYDIYITSEIIQVGIANSVLEAKEKKEQWTVN